MKQIPVAIVRTTRNMMPMKFKTLTIFTHSRRLLHFSLVFCFMAICAAGVKAEPQALDKVPAAVLDAIKAKFPGCELTKAAIEVKNDKPVHEVYFTFKGASMDVMARPGGFIFVVETIIITNDLPEAVAKAIQAKYPDASRSQRQFRVP